MAGWLWGPPRQVSQGPEHTNKRGSPLRARRTVLNSSPFLGCGDQAGLFVCCRVETLVPTALLASFLVLGLSGNLSPPCILPHICPVTLLCVLFSANPPVNGGPLESTSCLLRFRGPRCHGTKDTWSGGAGKKTWLSLPPQLGFSSLSNQLTWKMMTKARRADRMAQYCLENSYGFRAHGGSR